MSRTPGNTPTVLVTDADRGSAIAFIRALGRKGWRVIAADSAPNSLGFRSRYVADRVVYSAPKVDPGQMVETLLKVAREQHVDLLIPVTDDVILPLSAARDQFADVCTLAMADPDQLELVTNKLKTVELARKVGVPVPATVVVHTVQEALDASAAFDWPVVVKPQASRLFRDGATVDIFEVSYAQNPDALGKTMARFEGRCPVLLQEYFPGTGYGVEVLMHQGQPLAAFQHKRLREVPITGGASSFRESVPLDPALYEYSVRLLQALKWTGLAMVEYKVGAKGAQLMEINGRIWGSLPLAVLSGMDFPARMADLYLYGPPKSSVELDTRYTTGVRARNLEKDIVWIISVLIGKRRYSFLPMPGRWQAGSALLGMLNPRYKSDIFSMDDPRPGLAEIPKIATKLIRKGSKVGQTQEGTGA